jgi:hypothetical protein
MPSLRATPRVKSPGEAIQKNLERHGRRLDCFVAMTRPMRRVMRRAMTIPAGAQRALINRGGEADATGWRSRSSPRC